MGDTTHGAGRGGFGVFELDHRAGALFTPERIRAGIRLFLVLGVVARCVRFFLKFPLWADECFLAANYVDASYADLAGPLKPHQVAPLLYLWTQLSIVKLLGFAEYPLRLLSFLCGIGSLFLFHDLARRLVRGPALLFAVAVFAVAYPQIRYAAEAKPYGVDLFVSLALLWVVVRWWQEPAGTGRLWLLAAAAPVAVGLSYTAVFLLGGASLFLAYVLWTQRRRGWPAWVALNVALLAAFVGLMAISGREQATAELDAMRVAWRDSFPPLREPWLLPWWLVKIHAGRMLGYPAGGPNGGSAVTFLAFVVGIVALARRRRGALLLLLLAPLALHLAAAAMQRYPYGGHIRITLYLAPAFCLLWGVGWTAMLRTVAPTYSRARCAAWIPLVICAVVGGGSVVRDVARPWKTASDMRARAFARWFWKNAEYEGEVVCLRTDLGLRFAEEEDEELSWLSMYVCNQRIYSPRHAAGEPPHLDRVTATRPVRFVRYRVGSFPTDEAALARWLEETKARFDLVGKDSWAFTRYEKNEERLEAVDWLDVYKFVAKGGK